jgi:hypothetical protein
VPTLKRVMLEADDSVVSSESPKIEGCRCFGNAETGIGLTESERSDDSGSQTDTRVGTGAELHSNAANFDYVHSTPLHHSVGPSNGSESDSIGDKTTLGASFSTDNLDAGRDLDLPYSDWPLRRNKYCELVNKDLTQYSLK